MAARTSKEGELTYSKLNAELTKEFGEKGIGYKISDELDNPWIINVKDVSYDITHKAIAISSTSAEWEVSGNKLVAYLGTSKNIVIPNYVDGISTTVIGENIFKNTNIESLKIPKGITTIENSAFENCTNLTGDLIIPDSVTTIGNTAFSKCTNLTGKLFLPNSVTSLGGGVFQNDRFTNLELDLTTINPGVFTDNTELKGTIKFGKNVKTINSAAFQNCSGLTGDLIIPDNVEEIGYVAFKNCTGLTGKLYIGKGVTSIADNMHGSSSFIGDTFNNIEINMSNIPNCLFQETSWNSDKKCTLKGSLTIGNNVKTIGSCAFQGCSGLTGDLIIPDNVISMEWLIFKDCSGFDGTLYISNNISSIQWSTFENCTGLKNISEFGSKISTIDNSAFRNCKEITGDIVLPSSVTSIDAGVFSLCTKINSITVQNSVSNIGDGAFYDVKQIYYNGTASGSPWGAKKLN